MEKKYLNEETYRKGKKGLTIVSLIIFAIGLIAGGFLIYSGINKMNDKGNVSVEELEAKKEQLKQDIIPYQVEKNKEFDENGFSEKYYELKNKIESLNEEIRDVENEIFNIEHGSSNFASVPLFMFGGFIIFASLIIGGSLLLFANKRKILAFTAQQVMPVAKEGVEEMAPSIGKVAKEISKGIKEGTKDN